MTAANWTPDELDRIDVLEELEIAARRPDGTLRTPVLVWSVRLGDDLYVRSWHGTGGAWFRAARATGEGRISAAGVEKDVAFDAVSGEVDDAVDAAYLTKYGRHGVVTEMVTPPARDTTIKLVPQA